MLRRSIKQKVSTASRSNSSNSLSEEHLMEKIRSEHHLRASRPKPPMFTRSQLPNYSNDRRHQKSPTSQFRPTSIEEPSQSELKKLLHKKDNDLATAARLGTSLLEQNKELQEKNDFLEESLSISSDTITQLKKQLRQRSDLYQTLSNQFEGMDSEQDVGNEQQLSSMRLENKIRHLEGENEELRTKAKQLEELKAIAEKREERRINDYVSQLRAANLKVAQLLVQLGEKSRHCEFQAEEIQRLLTEIGQRKNREKMLWNENGDLHIRLDEALSSHEQLSLEIQELQERHLELIAMLRETEDELRMHREKAISIVPPRRNNSTDSLYDSLASELEGADSGCYNTPMFSASRYGPSPHWSSLSNGANDQPCCSSKIDQSEMAPIAENSLSQNELLDNKEHINLPQAKSFDIPSRALLQVVRYTFEDRKQFKRRSPSKCEMKIEMDEQKTPIVSEEQHIRERTTTHCQSEDEVDHDEQQADTQVGQTQPRFNKETVILRDASCSPIHFILHDPLTNGNQSEKQLLNGKGIVIKSMNTDVSIDAKQFWSQSLPPLQQTGHPTSPSTSSVDSLDGYSPPKLGVPGRPGTRDLDHRIRTIGLRKEIDEKYRNFRANKGLPSKPSFYSPHKPKIYGSSLSPSNQMKSLRFAPHCQIRDFPTAKLAKAITPEVPNISYIGQLISRRTNIKMDGVYCRLNANQ